MWQMTFAVAPAGAGGEDAARLNGIPAQRTSIIFLILQQMQKATDDNQWILCYILHLL